jgi:ketosteroid isomerase-like protein
MYKAAVRWMIRRNVRALRSGDIGPLLASYADEAVLRFPGQNPWAGEHRGKPAIEAFLRRFADDRLIGETHEILVNGPPWRTTVCVVFTVEARDTAGAVVYQNRAVLFVRAAWGKIVYQEDFEDTQKVEAFAEYLDKRRRSSPLRSDPLLPDSSSPDQVASYGPVDR